MGKLKIKYQKTFLLILRISCSVFLSLFALIAHTSSQDTSEADLAFIRVEHVYLRLEPKYTNIVAHDKVTFGEKVSIIKDEGDWLFVVNITRTRAGWIHKLAITKDAIEIKKIGRTKRIPSLLLYVDLDKSHIYILAGSLLTQQKTSNGYISRLLPGQAIFVSAVPHIIVSGFLNGNFKQGDPEPGSIYYLNKSMEFELWEHSKNQK